MMEYLPSTVLCVSLYILSVYCEEPQCYSKFDYDFKILQKLSELETKQREQQQTIDSQMLKIKALQDEIKECVASQWSVWTIWSDCVFDCTGNIGRVQYRQRTSKVNQTASETESRPCNAVQFSGCVRDYGEKDNYAVTYDSADQVAVSICTSINDKGGYVYAVRRECSTLAVSCEDTCKNVGLTCFNALHFHRQSTVQKRNQVGVQGLYMYRHNSCAGSYCGPNFCCCKK